MAHMIRTNLGTPKDTLPEHRGGLLFYTTPSGAKNIHVKLQGETTWMTQRAMANLFGVEIPVIATYLKDLFDSGELDRKTTISRAEMDLHFEELIGESYSLDAIMAVGLRLNTPQVILFRSWATKTLVSLVVNGFALDVERLKQDSDVIGQNYFDDLLEQIQEIRLSERNFFQKIPDIYALSVDYRNDAQITTDFYTAVRAKLAWAIKSKYLGFLSDLSVQALHRLVSAYLDLVERRARGAVYSTMEDWAGFLEEFLECANHPEMLDQEQVVTIEAKVHAVGDL
ncbi:hypothetical protein GETHLI_33980 [Geothrix limicola]|uniref:Uncharacterized protein n=1 Tax=Geothrix limicola TaxID=2927978 RepID=A0ABQ5QK06_9BACT|nr:RhuM family protein [Geothrix limicola]GLH74896.1 hypothetical protein GETHLI_33980 [Geothrix limicola]